MAYDAEQQESIAAVKDWFENNANWLLGAALLAVAIVGGNWAWRWYVQREAYAASALYEQYQQAVVAKDASKARDLASALLQQHPSNVYSTFAALAQARVSLDTGDNAAAKAQLHWVIDHSDNKELSALARVRLAGILLDEKAYDEGLALLDAEAPKAMAVEFSDRRGDLLLAQGKTAQARSAYAQALEQAGAQNPLRPIIQTKLDAIAGAS
ncbi:MAG TPA: tetratricopeptide repeat protein [Burkholderiaceae bacterium]|jgi:predicted negative regulator of RcsB-dependent stress response|nr:tetratricopeptide repeat protein [Burkholderiaceae bacterium]